METGITGMIFSHCIIYNTYSYFNIIHIGAEGDVGKFAAFGHRDFRVGVCGVQRGRRIGGLFPWT